MRIIALVRDWIAGARSRRMIHQIARHYHRVGVVAPYVAAIHEMYLRVKLMDFQDFASKRYLEDQSLTLDEIKQEWLDIVVKPMAKSQFTRDDAKALKAAITAIGHRDSFVGEARKTYLAEVKTAVALAKSRSVYIGQTI